MRTRILSGGVILGLIIAHPFSQAQEHSAEPAELTQARAQYEALGRSLHAKIQEAIKLRSAKYVNELKALEKQVAATGNLDSLLPVKAERDAYESGISTTGFKANDPLIPANARQLRAAFDADLGKISKYAAGVEQNYATEYSRQLQGLERKLTIEGRIDDAIAIRTEKTKTLLSSSAPVANADPIPAAPAEAGPADNHSDLAQGTHAPNSFLWARLFEFLQSAAKNAAVSKSELGKPPDMGKPFTDIRKDGGFLVGFELTKGDWFGFPLFQSIQPIYFTPKGKEPGQRRGNLGHDPFKIEARDGYAVSSVALLPGHFMFSIQLTFMKIDLLRQALDPADSYKSKVYGDIDRHPEWAPSKQLGKDTPIIGLFGYAENFINGLGVVSAPHAP